jgi:hypothetical protein
MRLKTKKILASIRRIPTSHALHIGHAGHRDPVIFLLRLDGLGQVMELF